MCYIYIIWFFYNILLKRKSRASGVRFVKWATPVLQILLPEVESPELRETARKQRIIEKKIARRKHDRSREDQAVLKRPRQTPQQRQTRGPLRIALLFFSFNFFVSYSVWLPRKCAGESKATEFHLKLKFFVPQLLSQHFFSWQRQVKIRSWQQIMTLFFYNYLLR